MNKGFVCSTLCLVGLVHAGCSSQSANDPAEETGSIQAALQLPDPSRGPTFDVESIHYIVVKDGEFCNSPTPVADKTVKLEPNPLPVSLLPDGGGNMHPFADALFVLAAGKYTVCALPVREKDAGGGPSSICEADVRSVTVFAGATSEQLFVAQCRPGDNGAIDAITILNSQPVITDLKIDPSKFITQCQSATLSATAFDPDGDSFTFTWQVLNTSGGVMASAMGPVVTFFPGSVRDFQIRLLVRDGRFNANFVQGVAQLTFPIHVSACADAGPDPSPSLRASP